MERPPLNPGDRGAPIHFSIEQQAFKAPPRDEVKQRKQEVDQFSRRKPLGAKPDWNASAQPANFKPYAYFPSRTLSRYQPLEKANHYDFHSPAPIPKNPLMSVPKPEKFNVDPLLHFGLTPDPPGDTGATRTRGKSAKSSNASRARSSSPRRRPTGSALPIHENAATRLDVFSDGEEPTPVERAPEEAESEGSGEGVEGDDGAPSVHSEMSGPGWNASTYIDPKERAASSDVQHERTKQHKEVLRATGRLQPRAPTLVQRETQHLEAVRQARALAAAPKPASAPTRPGPSPEMEATRKKVWRDMQATRGPPNLQIARTHPGTYGFVAVEQREGWSCCMAFARDAPGCAVQVANRDRWQLGGFDGSS
ncbi:hypothetical protein PAPYR_684 [Paratrimastix pyriformis]|uniref:Uncharacterized protein n=1 Tax=Paratrimastix pyriformis TaxID=342808 RepID=A0ABQ8UX32_9EUKA|nr:hypothetical protein PAPYR_684 [Paratrimastix pyriformis]